MDDVLVDENAENPLRRISNNLEFKRGDMETYRLHEANKNNALEPPELQPSTPRFETPLHPSIKAKDTDNTKCQSNQPYHLRPEVTEMRRQGTRTVRVRRLRRFQNYHRYDIRDRELKYHNPAQLRP